mmetsp:Transcript_55472/g.168611  ORF Transcript_55472/g.168611 Transcript_55472/m.168611 type:complete len:257 (-) Transcript_55472:1407-2177(-)
MRLATRAVCVMSAAIPLAGRSATRFETTPTIRTTSRTTSPATTKAASARAGSGRRGGRRRRRRPPRRRPRARKRYPPAPPARRRPPAKDCRPPLPLPLPCPHPVPRPPLTLSRPPPPPPPRRRPRRLCRLCPGTRPLASWRWTAVAAPGIGFTTKRTRAKSAARTVAPARPRAPSWSTAGAAVMRARGAPWPGPRIARLSWSPGAAGRTIAQTFGRSSTHTTTRRHRPPLPPQLRKQRPRQVPRQELLECPRLRST